MFLQHIGFDSSVRLPGNVYYFEYQGVRFKLVQNNPRKYSNHLLTIVRDHDTATRSAAFRAAAGFLSAWAFGEHAAVMLWDSGGSGRTPNRPLRSAKPNIFGPPKLGSRGLVMIGGELCTIPHVENEQQRIALALFREAEAMAFSGHKTASMFQRYVVKSSARHRESVRRRDEYLERRLTDKKSEAPTVEFPRVGVSSD